MGFFLKRKTIVTHSGKFHADDILSVATLLLLPEWKNAKVFRSRETSVIEKADLVLDVGGIYDPLKLRFDHHQSGGAGGRPSSVPYSSFGLIWKEFGQKICGSEEVSRLLDTKIVAPVDACDNGFQTQTPLFSGYGEYVLDDIAGAFNPTWKEEQYDEDGAFMELVSVAQMLLKREIIRAQAKVEAVSYVEDIYTKTEDKRVIIFPGYYPWQEVIRKYPEPLFVVLPRKTRGEWAVHAIPKSSVGFENRKDLPKEWAGLVDEAFVKASGVPGVVFCHNALYMAVAGSKEGALKLAELALKA